MAYRFAPASNPFIDISCGDLVGDNPRNTSSGGWTIAAGLNLNGTSAWQGIGILHDGSTELLFILELDPSNHLVGDDNLASWSSSTAITDTTNDLIVALSWDGTDNVANNARWSWKIGASAWVHENETINIGQQATAIQSTWRIRIGNNLGTSDDANYDLYTWGYRLGPRSQTEIEALSLGSGGWATWQTMFDIPDSILHRFDNISALTDQANGNANETARSAAGITLVTDPSGFYGGGGATATAVPAAGTGDLPAPTIAAAATVTAPPADATGDFPDDMPLSVTVATGPAAGTGDLPAPTVTGGSGAVDATVTAPPADATGDQPAPAVAASSTVTSPPADSTGQAPPPAPAGTSAGTVQAVPADAAGDQPAPAVSADAAAFAAAMRAAGAMLPPGFTVTAQITATPAAGTGDFPIPTHVGAPAVRLRNGAQNTGATVISARLTNANEPEHVTGGSEPAHFTGGEPVLETTGAQEIALV